jgi:hypothetical protein
VFCNHVFLVVDSETYQAITHSVFLCDKFASFRHKTTHAGTTESWTGTYLYGQHTYIEFFDSQDTKWAQAGWGGIAFSVDQLGSLHAFHERLRTTFKQEFFDDVRHLTIDGVSVPWFHFVNIAHGFFPQTVDAWIMAYYPEMFRQKHLTIPASGVLTREEHLTAWKSENTPRNMRDVLGVTLVLDDASVERVRLLFQCLGYDQIIRNDETIMTSGDFTLRLIGKDTPPTCALKAMTLSLWTPHDTPAEVELSPQSKLVFGPELTADWLFQYDL